MTSPPSSSSPSSSNPRNHHLPVIIVGAGPCGLVAALTLQRHNINFVIVEKATREKLCSNAGAGFELSSTALQVLRKELNVDTDKIMLEYGGFHMLNMEGTLLRDTPVELPDSKKKRKKKKKKQSINNGKTKKKPDRLRLASANRAELQNLLLDQLFPNGSEDDKEDGGVLLCGKGVSTYEEDPVSQTVTVTLDDDNINTQIKGCAVLACDGIHSKIRSIMHPPKDDPMNFCGVITYWAKCSIPPGSDMERHIQATQNYTSSGASFIGGFGTKSRPGSLFVVPTNGRLIWILFEQSKEPPKNKSNDLTRRGGGIMDEAGKQDLIRRFGSTNNSWDFPLLDAVLDHTRPEDITEAGLFDRTNLKLPYTSPGKLVALLGDAAHPQTPFLGQGVNMAINDAYVYATRIAWAVQQQTNNSNVSSSDSSNVTTGNNHHPIVADAISKCDTKQRRKQAAAIVREARMTATNGVSSNRFVTWFVQQLIKILPLREIINTVERYDKSNRKMVEKLHQERDARTSRKQLQ